MLPSLITLKHAPLEMKRRVLPNFTPPMKRQQKDGWETRENEKVNASDRAEFYAAMANLDSFYGSIQIDWKMTDDDVGELEDIMWDTATDVHKRAFGKALRIWHKKEAKATGDSSASEAELYTPDEWYELFHQRHGWNVEKERIEDDNEDDNEDDSEDDTADKSFTERLTLIRERQNV